MRSSQLLASICAGFAAAHKSSTLDPYAPYEVDCPAGFELTRTANGLLSQELDWVRSRKRKAADAFSTYLARLNLTDFDHVTYSKLIKNNSDAFMPTLAFANSGGAWRSAFTGIGALRAFDDRTTGANDAKVGGLYQSLTYFSGLSGGSWPVLSTTLNGDVPIQRLVEEWHVDISRFDADNYTAEAVPLTALFEQIASKAGAGFNVSVSDLLGRAFAYEFFPQNATFSSVAELSTFKDANVPFPLLAGSSMNTSTRTQDGLYYPTDEATPYEWSPFEFGSWDIGFTPMKYLGTIPGAAKCIKNLDQISFVSGSVAAAYNGWYLAAFSNNTLGQPSYYEFSQSPEGYNFTRRTAPVPPLDLFSSLDGGFQEAFGYNLSQIVNPSIPNPFGGAENLTFVDNYETGQAVPFWPLIQPERKVDLIFAWDDASSDITYDWNNGAYVWTTYNIAKQAGLPFPQIPSVSTWLARDYFQKPVIFGCNTSLTTTGDARSPIIVYMANTPYSWYSNFSGFATSMPYEEFNGVLTNSFDIVTQGNGTLNNGDGTKFTDCLGCAAIDRSLEKLGMKRTAQCEQCFAEWCWDGTTSEVADDFIVDPSLALDPSLGFVEWNKTHPFSD